ncbi:MAG TPA: fumarylacetoacetate hydrolase family protein [Bryobacteraceae bacterium]|jgi:2-keto-4-pentenoate hydratase/2-oxohepta-3-ene-1,7-dioic acid hydratase in catechol pathway
MTRFVRYRAGAHTAYGILEDGVVTEVEGTLFEHKLTSVRRKLSEVTLLYPGTPGKILAVGRNYTSHFGTRPQPTHPEIFYKPISCLQHPDGPVVIPPDSTDLHHEAELVLVIGKRVRHASRAEAEAAIFGVTCGNDISDRAWQGWQGSPAKDLQWWRAKGCDTFGPLGPVVVTGADYGNLRVQCRLNGEVVQDQSTADLIFDCATVVSFISRYLTLEQGDLIFTGTPGETRPMKPGDVVEVEIENIGVLRNPMVAES